MLDHLRRAFRVTALAVATVALLATTALAASPSPSPSPAEVVAPAAGVDLASFGIAPAGAERPDDRPYLDYSAAAGSVIYDHVALLNQDDAPVDLQLYGGDVVMADGGGLAVPAHDQASTDAGAWISLDTTGAVTVPAQSTTTGIGYTIVPFTLTIPANAEPGDHVGGIVGSLVAAGHSGANTPSIDLEQRVVARVYIRVAGALAPGLAVTDVTTSFRSAGALGAGPGTVEVGYTLRNTGNVRMAVQPAVRVAGPFGLLARTARGDRVDELLPGGQVRLTTTVAGAWPLVRETVTVSATGLAAATGADPHLGTVTVTAHVWAIPWAVLALVVLVLALGVLRMVRRRRRRGGPTRPEGAPTARSAPHPAPPAATVARDVLVPGGVDVD